MIQPLTTSLAELQKIAFNNRPDYLKALNGMNLSKIRLGVAKNRRLWELNFESGIGESNQDKNFGEASKGLADLGESEWNAGLKLTIPFGDWFRHEPYVGALIDLKNQRISLKEIKQKYRNRYTKPIAQCKNSLSASIDSQTIQSIG